METLILFVTILAVAVVSYSVFSYSLTAWLLYRNPFARALYSVDWRLAKIAVLAVAWLLARWLS